MPIKKNKYYLLIEKIIQDFLKEHPNSSIKLNIYNKETLPKKKRNEVSIDWKDPYADGQMHYKMKVTRKGIKFFFVINIFLKKTNLNIDETGFYIFLHELSHCYAVMTGKDNPLLLHTERETWYDTIMLFNRYKEILNNSWLSVTRFMDCMVTCLGAYKKAEHEEY